MCLEIFIRIGVTGHRIIRNELIIREKVNEILFEIDKLLKHSHYHLIAVSPLAEGADRIVSEEILGWKGKNFLEVIIPMDKNEYLNDFKSEKSKNEFKNLITQSNSTQILKIEKNRDESYENVGKTIIHNCNLLIAVWDGKSAAGKGGTEKIVNYAREIGRSLFWINSDTYELKKEFNTDNTLEYLKKMDNINKKSSFNQD